jgi:spore maturation protein CgeB
MTDGEDSLLYNDPKEFAEKLGILIENAELRKTLGEAGKKRVLETRHYLKTAPGLFEFYKELRARKMIALEA